ncbi:MAG: zinc-ribbon domain-containing protein [Oscillospiraceae bacterium]|nr:zinc-ribbon domain-containing protein [Oscillospiraceae bacterium]
MFCPNCGQEVSDDALFCGSCGFKIEKNADIQQTENQEPEAHEEAETYAQVPETPVQPEETEQPETYEQQPEANTQQSEQASEQQAAAKSNSVSAADIANKAKSVGGEALNKANAAADSATAAVQKVIPGVNKKILIIACAALVVIIVLCFVLFANLVGGGSSAFTRVPHYAFTANNDGDLALFIDGKAVTADADYNFDSSGSYAYNANAIVYNGVLYRIDSNKLSEVNDDVKSVKLSSSANAFVYISDDGLYIYKDGKETLIYDDFEGSISSSKVVVSPNGNTVVFTDRDDGDYVTYIYRGSNAEKIGKNIYPLSVSDDASALYAYKYLDGSADSTLYLYKNSKVDNSVKVKSDVTGIKAYSKDNKKVLFTSSSGTFYYAPNLGDAVKVDSGSVTPIYPSYTINRLDDFKDFIALDGTSVKRFMLKGGSYEKYTIASSVSSYRLSMDGKKLVYLKGDKLYSIATMNENAEATKLGEDIVSFYASSDLSKIYAKNDDRELVFSNGKSEKTTKITDDVETFSVSLDGVCCYIIDEVLYSTSGAAKGTKVDKMSDVTGLTISGGSVFYVYNDGTLYLSTNGRSFEKTNVER